jgi:hypothetical protein
MSYAVSGPLQAAVYGALAADVTLDGLVSGAIYDALPAGTLPDLYVLLGDETVRDASDGSGRGAAHVLTVSVVTTAQGFAGAKAAAGAVSDVLHGADLALSRGRLVWLRFSGAKARRVENASRRQIDLRFDARVEDL